MKRYGFATSLALASGAALVFALAIGGSGQNPVLGEPPLENPRTRLVIGDATVVQGNVVVTWARVRANGDIKQVGVAIPVALFDNQPTDPGDGPAGAIASLVFPEIVRDNTFFNHFELHSNPYGHDTALGSANPIRNSVPHFDFHFYAIDEAAVLRIPATRPGPPFVLPALLPAGYRQPGPSISQMGRHTTAQSNFDDPGFLIADMITGFLPNATQMHFIEPMVSRELLLERNDFALPVPRPAVFGRTMRYPKEFTAEYDADSDAYHFIFSGFETVE